MTFTKSLLSLMAIAGSSAETPIHLLGSDRMLLYDKVSQKWRKAKEYNQDIAPERQFGMTFEGKNGQIVYVPIFSVDNPQDVLSRLTQSGVMQDSDHIAPPGKLFKKNRPVNIELNNALQDINWETMRTFFDTEKSSESWGGWISSLFSKKTPIALPDSPAPVLVFPTEQEFGIGQSNARYDPSYGYVLIQATYKMPGSHELETGGISGVHRHEQAHHLTDKLLNIKGFSQIFEAFEQDVNSGAGQKMQNDKLVPDAVHVLAELASHIKEVYNEDMAKQMKKTLDQIRSAEVIPYMVQYFGEGILNKNNRIMKEYFSKLYSKLSEVKQKIDTSKEVGGKPSTFVEQHKARAALPDKNQIEL